MFKLSIKILYLVQYLAVKVSKLMEINKGKINDEIRKQGLHFQSYERLEGYK